VSREQVDAQLRISISMAEGAFITDLASARAQWEPINTDEVTDWILVNTSKPN